ncbi:MAG: cupin domain-containing protein [candidate division KSB1 bacterium]|nr:cupin domain-containing protein [candidate division KSB1 bacterium]
MKIVHYTEVEAQAIAGPEVSGVTKRVLLSAADGAPNFTMRLFHVAPGGYTFFHSHDFEHEIFVTEGHGQVVTEDGSRPIEAGYAILVLPGEVHQFKNTGTNRMSFLCLVPNRAES